MISSGSTPPAYRALFISDVHLGMRGSQAEQLIDFLRYHDAETIYLVGDIVDGWALKSNWLWPQSHNDIVQKLLRKVRKGTRIVYLPGNHDDFVRRYTGNTFGGIEIVEKIVHTTADGKRLLVLHGDQFDTVIRHAKWLALIGDHAYDAALALNVVVNRVRSWMGYGYWSLSRWAKLKVKRAVSFIGSYEQTLVKAAREHDVDGVVCGHIHHPALHEDFGLIYVNCGDWVESCTAACEHADGRLEIIHWPSRRAAGVPWPIEAEPEPERVAA